jgi:hypothetical protein
MLVSYKSSSIAAGLEAEWCLEEDPYIMTENDPSQICVLLGKPEAFLEAHAEFSMNKSFLVCINKYTH